MEYKISQLAEKTDTTKRTIHYYIGKGLLPPPLIGGIKSVYTEEHVYRIFLIRKMQEQFLPLNEIRDRINNLTLEEIKILLEDGKVPEKQVPRQEIIFGEEYVKLKFLKDMELSFPKKLLATDRAQIESIKIYIERLITKD